MDPRSNQHQLRRGEIRSAPFTPPAFGFWRELRSAPLPLLFIENLQIFDDPRDEERFKSLRMLTGQDPDNKLII